jgi:hypothetical protein
MCTTVCKLLLIFLPVNYFPDPVILAHNIINARRNTIGRASAMNLPFASEVSRAFSIRIRSLRYSLALTLFSPKKQGPQGPCILLFR